MDTQGDRDRTAPSGVGGLSLMSWTIVQIIVFHKRCGDIYHDPISKIGVHEINCSIGVNVFIIIQFLKAMYNKLFKTTSVQSRAPT